MFDNKLSKVLTFGLSTFFIAAVIMRIGKVYLLKEYEAAFPWFNILGIVFIALALLFFIIERRSNLPFFYGASQRGGSNANSFIVAAIGLNFLSLNNVQFIIYMLALICAMLLLAYPVKAKS